VNKKLLSLYGLKWNPFSPDVPAEALLQTPRIDAFCWRVENLAREGGFALVAGDPGAGKSSTLRILVERLSAQRDLKVGLLSRPQARVADFYREMGDLFGVPLAPHNRWAGAKALREKWQGHIDGALFRPVLVIDEAQAMLPSVLDELRLLASARLDSHLLLTTVFAGDARLLKTLSNDDLAPLSSRIRVRLTLERASPAELEDCLRHALAKAGAARLMTPELVTTLCEHATGNCRTLMNLGNELLAAGAQREARQLDEKLFLEVFAVHPSAATPAKTQATGRRHEPPPGPSGPCTREPAGRSPLARRRPVGRGGRRHRRRRAQVLQIVPCPRYGRRRCLRHRLPPTISCEAARSRPALRC
jgi:general secretion pathway protein A